MKFLTKRPWALWIVIAVTAISASLPVRAGTDSAIPRIQVSGEGRVDIAPDMAVLSLTVTRQAKTARAALDANSAAMKDVLGAMASQGVNKKDLQTSRFSIQPKYFYAKPSASGERPAPEIVGYSVRNSLTVRVRNINSVGSILDKSISLGVNDGGNISFTNSDPSKAIAQARALAVKDAIAKAGTLAKAAGVSTGDILEISEPSGSQRPAPMVRSTMMMAESSDAVPVARGENTYTVSVNVSFAIKQ
ncbi:MAG: hypothetical protein ACI8QT_001864 [Halioglobus sp.]|jgi:uncharacterized protein YggE